MYICYFPPFGLKLILVENKTFLPLATVAISKQKYLMQYWWSSSYLPLRTIIKFITFIKPFLINSFTNMCFYHCHHGEWKYDNFRKPTFHNRHLTLRVQWVPAFMFTIVRPPSFHSSQCLPLYPPPPPVINFVMSDRPMTWHGLKEEQKSTISWTRPLLSQAWPKWQACKFNSISIAPLTVSYIIELSINSRFNFPHSF